MYYFNYLFQKVFKLTSELSNFYISGGTQIRTGDRGFAIHCLTTWPYRLSFVVYYYKLIF